MIFFDDLPLYTVDLFADDTTLIASVDYKCIEEMEDILSREVLDVDYWATAKELPLNSSKTKTILIGYGILPPKKISDLPTLSVFKQHILQLDLNSLLADPQC